MYAPLSERQRELYDAILNKSLRQLLIKKKQESESLEEIMKGGRGKRTRRKVNYRIDEDEDEEDRLEEIENGSGEQERRVNEEENKHADELAAGRSFLYSNTGVFSACVLIYMRDFLITSRHSQTGEFDEVTKYRYATSESLLPSFPVRLAH